MNAATNSAINIIQYCIRQTQRNNLQVNSYNFAQRSYEVWAAKEILKKIKNTKDMPPLYIIEEFRDLMDDYSCRKKNNSFLFSCAKDMAEWIIDLLIA